jgi:excisionase family DNA binding protein
MGRTSLDASIIPDIVTTKEAAAMLRVSPDTVCRLITSGKLSATRPGKRFLISRQSILRYLPQDTPDHTPPVRTAAVRIPDVMAYAKPLRARAQ